MLALEKVIASFLSLPGLFILLYIPVVIYLLRKGRSVLIKVLTVLLLMLMVITFTGWGTRVLVIPLERRYQETGITENLPVVVMGGGIHYSLNGRQATLNSVSLQRLVKGYQLYRKNGGPLLYTGGVAIGQIGPSEAEIAANWLREMGVPAQEIVAEEQARTSFENGLYVKAWLSERGARNKIYLVTSALHLPRTVLVFQKQGIDVVPVPAGYISDHRLSWLSYLPNRGSLNANLAALHEWLGIIWYTLRDRI